MILWWKNTKNICSSTNMIFGKFAWNWLCFLSKEEQGTLGCHNMLQWAEWWMDDDNQNDGFDKYKLKARDLLWFFLGRGGKIAPKIPLKTYLGPFLSVHDLVICWKGEFWNANNLVPIMYNIPYVMMVKDIRSSFRNTQDVDGSQRWVCAGRSLSKMANLD